MKNKLEILKNESDKELYYSDVSSLEQMRNPSDFDIEDLKSTALKILNEPNQFTILQMIDFLEDFKNSTLEHIEDLKHKSYAEISINKFTLYVKWLDRQLAVLRNNDTRIVN